MRSIKIPFNQVKEWMDHPVGAAGCFIVLVDWPELQLTEDQRLANAVARVDGNAEPFEDKSIFQVEISREMI